MLLLDIANFCIGCGAQPQKNETCQCPSGGFAALVLLKAIQIQAVRACVAWQHRKLEERVRRKKCVNLVAEMSALCGLLGLDSLDTKGAE